MKRAQAGFDEGVACFIGVGSDCTAFGVVVEQAHRLHESVDGGRADKFPAALFQIVRQSDRCSRNGRGLGFAEVFGTRLEAPHISGQRPFFFNEFSDPLGIVHDGLDLASMAHDAGILEQALDVHFAEFGDAACVEIRESGAEILALGQDRAPAEAGLETFQA